MLARKRLQIFIQVDLLVHQTQLAPNAALFDFSLPLSDAPHVHFGVHVVGPIIVVGD